MQEELKAEVPLKYIDSISPAELGKAYEDVKRTAFLCERAMRIAGLRITYGNKQQELNVRIKELEKFESFSEIDRDTLKKLIERLHQTNGEKTNLRSQITSFDKVLDYLEPLEKEVLPAIKEMEEAESKQRMVKQDISYIQGERAELEFQREGIDKSLRFIYKFTVWTYCRFFFYNNCAWNFIFFL